jgi:hypothetical protein
VVAAIDLDDEALLQTHEIDDVGPDRMLAAEAMPADLPLAQLAPELPPGLAHCFPQTAGAVVGHVARLAPDTAPVTPTEERHRT